ncbi:fluoride efflux transporter CrcB [Pseudalkalibacillus berkeleyi]|uniref:Fluoride-specific ion channel FluC n=1 Tax=Pseudalkalibacillus berkeleyi TaxID=1069813 RepID=A0ABS9H3Y3_9BACL|nr:fluoride efflux transporter CrcB [Pseudalkalibacillus berkeleyi]MCF6138636.1 fluoride efflux transporter CrcB [Pseudalkalibacillus berkeleyi]
MMILIGLGGSLGAAARYLIGQFLHNKSPNSWMNGTWVVNIAGSFLLGILASLYTTDSLTEWIWLFFGIGFCGAFTTFSTFSVEALKMLQSEKYTQAILYIVTSVFLGAIAAFTGFIVEI